MNNTLVEYLACPKCNADLRLDTPDEGAEIISGTLTCTACGCRYGIVRGVPRLNEELAEHHLENVARTFGFEWKAHHQGKLEDETLFGRTRAEDWAYIKQGMQIDDSGIEGAVVLEAGCGSGRFCQLFSEHGASVVIGVDINEAVDEAYAYCRDYPNVHIVQGNIFALPFKKHIFDRIWSNGVIHHTPDAAGAHRALTRHVKQGGILYVWVYTKRFNPFRFVKTIFNVTRISKLPPRALLLLSKAMVYPSLALLAVYRGVRKLPGLRPKTAWGRRTIRPRTVKELQLTWFDALSPEFDSRHTEEEVTGWFRAVGFRDVAAIEEPKVGVRGVAPDLARTPVPETFMARR